jgi:hypothetical protein
MATSNDPINQDLNHTHYLRAAGGNPGWGGPAAGDLDATARRAILDILKNDPETQRAIVRKQFQRLPRLPEVLTVERDAYGVVKVERHTVFDAQASEMFWGIELEKTPGTEKAKVNRYWDFALVDDEGGVPFGVRMNWNREFGYGIWERGSAEPPLVYDRTDTKALEVRPRPLRYDYLPDAEPVTPEPTTEEIERSNEAEREIEAAFAKLDAIKETQERWRETAQAIRERAAQQEQNATETPETPNPRQE